MNYCTKCGKEIPEGDNKYCDDCKNSLLTDIENDEDNKFAIKKDQKVEKEAKPKKTGKVIGIIVGIVLLLAVVGGVCLEFSTGMISHLVTGKNIVGIDIGNNNNNLGCANIQGDWIYYMSLANDGMEIALNRVRTNGKDKQVLAQKDWEIYSINVVGNYIYFVAFEPTDEVEAEATSTAYQKNRIYKMSLDGKELRVINDGNFSSEGVSIYVVKDRIYYVGENYNVYSMDTEGGDRKKINDNQTGFVGITDKYILYNDYAENPTNEYDFVTYIMNLDGSNPRVVNGKRLYNPNLVGDTIYYVNSENNAIHKVKVDGSGDEKIFESRAYNMNVQGDWIYYLDYKDEEASDVVCIHKVKTDGTEHQIIVEMENYTSFINVLKDWIYYTDHSDNSYFINLIKTDGSDTINLYEYNFNGPSVSPENSTPDTVTGDTNTTLENSNTASSDTNTVNTANKEEGSKNNVANTVTADNTVKQ